jgi:hypothetical protein
VQGVGGLLSVPIFPAEQIFRADPLNTWFGKRLEMRGGGGVRYSLSFSLILCAVNIYVKLICICILRIYAYLSCILYIGTLKP